MINGENRSLNAPRFLAADVPDLSPAPLPAATDYTGLLIVGGVVLLVALFSYEKERQKHLTPEQRAWEHGFMMGNLGGW